MKQKNKNNFETQKVQNKCCLGKIQKKEKRTYKINKLLLMLERGLSSKTFIAIFNLFAS
jgi:hypothetical protein